MARQARGAPPAVNGPSGDSRPAEKLAQFASLLTKCREHGLFRRRIAASSRQTGEVGVCGWAVAGHASGLGAV